MKRQAVTRYSDFGVALHWVMAMVVLVAFI